MWNYNRIHCLTGWIVFLVAATTYGLTVEPSASFWDCPEFILSATKLEIGHPPGAPFFMLTGNLFSHLATDPTQIPYMINLMNALLSAGCILFLYLTITLLAKKLHAGKDDDLQKWQIITVIASGMTGALVFCFSDTFWYSAVEGEVYAFSSFLTAVTFWCILKWESEYKSVSSDRWIVLLAYLTGLSIGVHLLNLLCIPAICLIVACKMRPEINRKQILLSLLASFMLIGVILYGIVPGLMKLAGYTDLLFVNQLGFGFNTGTMVCTLLLFVLTGSGVYYYQRNGKRNRKLHLLSLSLMVLLTGYSSYALILIRSNAGVTMNQQSPDNPFALKDYMGREQYGQAPLIYGQTFVSPRALKEDNGKLSYAYNTGETKYERDLTSSKDRYAVTGTKMTECYQPETCMFFPRLYSAAHAESYKAWLGKSLEKKVSYQDKITGRKQVVTIPSMADNIRFFVKYQLNFMYWRYFLWNFAGRQNDIQSHGEPEHGNWITGISLIDRILVKAQPVSPEQPANKGRNVYYALPLLLGLLGIYGQLHKGRTGKLQFLVVFMFFFMTGIAIVIYLNQTPMQPRERDYAYAGSFYAFAIWIGLGVSTLTDMILKKTERSRCPGALITGICSLAIPIQVFSQTLDDHDRSGRYVCRDIATNYLSSLQTTGEPIIFVNADNDTFPLWYATGVEGIRRDVRACNLMYLSGGWYVEQMRKRAYESSGFPLSLPSSFYQNDRHYAIPVNPVIRREYATDGSPREIRIKEIITDYYNRNPGTTKYGKDPFAWENIVTFWLNNPDESLRCIPTDEVHFPIDSIAVKRSGINIPDHIRIPDVMKIPLSGRDYLTRPGIVLLDLIQGCNWERPLYLAVSAPQNEYIDLSDYLLTEGLAARIVPFNVRENGYDLDLETTYSHVMSHYRFGGLDNPSLYLDDVNKSMARTLHLTMARLAEGFIQNGEPEKAISVLDRCLKEFNDSVFRGMNYPGNDYIRYLQKQLTIQE